jgi:serine/threonine-protein kinase
MTSVPWFSSAVTGVLLLALLWGLTPLAVRISAFYQLFVQKLALSNAGGGIIEAFSETVRARSTKLKLAPAHPHLQSFIESLVWIVFCYVVLFSLVVFSSDAIEAAILNIFYFAFQDAGIQPPALTSFYGPIRLFLASIIAAFGTAPFGLMACTFLPNRAPREVLLSRQGILVPQEFTTGGLAPIRLWKDLREAKIIGGGKDRRDRSLRLRFHRTGSFTIAFRLLSVEQVSELFATIEEYAVDCKLDENTATFRAQIAAECPARSDEIKAFTSTIFKTHEAGSLVVDGRYRIVRLIASKPLTAVYLARSADSKLVVVKQFVMPRDDEACRKLKETFRREYETLKRLDHPMIAKVLDIADDDRGCYLVIEHVRGEDLRSLVTRCGARSSKIIREWATELCQQMQYLHSQDPPLIHRDLSPDNIMLSEDGSIRIIDFGAAHQFVEGVTGTLIGKQCYIAPEQLRGRASIRSDIYSFGCTLFFLAAGKDPAALRQCDPISLGIKVPADLNEVISRCTDFEETARPQSFEEVGASLSCEVLCIE